MVKCSTQKWSIPSRPIIIGRLLLVDLKMAQAIAGHADIETTLEVDAHVRQKNVEEAGRKSVLQWSENSVLRRPRTFKTLQINGFSSSLVQKVCKKGSKHKTPILQT